MSAPSARERRAHELLGELLERPTGERRAGADQACGEDRELRALVERLLLAAEDPTEPELLAAAAAARRRPLGAEDPSPLPAGTRLGAWRVAAEIGRGGMARVYRAERVDGGFRQVAALKVLSEEIATPSAVRRFAQERQILAGLSHPNIAAVLDGGVTPEGALFLALELVEGEPIDRFADHRGLTLAARLRLLAKVARAVQYAHTHLVVHRDLKPSNVFVTADGIPKLLDFGIAKVLDPEAPVLADQGAAPATRTQFRVFTPAWASPEQVRGEPIGTASDVYQLGLLLYRLVAGRDAHELRDTSWSELERVICTVEPPALRHATGERTVRANIPPDLERIVRMALAKEPDRRYGTAGELADDLERLLADLPVRARPDSTGYRLRKFVRRHRLAVGGAALLLLVLVLATVALSLLARRLATERDRALLEETKAREVADFLALVFESADPDRGTGHEPTAREILERGTARLEGELAEQPEVLSEMLARVAGLHLQLARYAEGERLAGRAQQLAAGLRPPERRTEALAIHLLGWAASRQGRLREAEEHYDEAFRLREELLGPDAHDTVESLVGRGSTRHDLGELESARADLEEVVMRRRRGAESSPWRVANDFQVLGLIELDAGRLEEAETALREAERTLAQGIAVDDPRRAFLLNNLARVLEAKRDLDSAEELYRRSLLMKTELYGKDDPSVGVALHNLARILYRKGALDEALATGERALAMRRESGGSSHPDVALTLFNLGLVERDLDRPSAALERLVEAESIETASLGADHRRTRTTRVQLALVLLDLGRGSTTEAAAAIAAGEAAARAELGSPPSGTGTQSAFLLGVLACAEADFARGLPWLEAALAARRAARGAEDRLSIEAELHLALCRRAAAAGDDPESAIRSAAFRLGDSTPRLQRVAAEALRTIDAAGRSR